MSKREDVAECITTLIVLIDDDHALDDIAALLSAVGAACLNEQLAIALIDAINPIMVEMYLDITGRNN